MKSYRYLIFGTSRPQLADALCEYRRVATHDLLEVAQQVRAGLREQRGIMRACGDSAKVNAHIGLSDTDRATLRAQRRARFDEVAAMREP